MTESHRKNKTTRASSGRQTTARRVTRGTTSANRAAASKGSTGTSRTVSGKANRHPVVSEEQRRRWIEEAAYFRAERRGFRGGSPEEDWLAAEAEFNAARRGGRAGTRRRG